MDRGIYTQRQIGTEQVMQAYTHTYRQAEIHTGGQFIIYTYIHNDIHPYRQATIQAYIHTAMQQYNAMHTYRPTYRETYGQKHRGAYKRIHIAAYTMSNIYTDRRMGQVAQGAYIQAEHGQHGRCHTYIHPYINTHKEATNAGMHTYIHT